jgi:hypothetical protein
MQGITLNTFSMSFPIPCVASLSIASCARRGGSQLDMAGFARSLARSIRSRVENINAIIAARLFSRYAAQLSDLRCQVAQAQKDATGARETAEAAERGRAAAEAAARQALEAYEAAREEARQKQAELQQAQVGGCVRTHPTRCFRHPSIHHATVVGYPHALGFRYVYRVLNRYPDTYAGSFVGAERIAGSTQSMKYTHARAYERRHDNCSGELEYLGVY